MASPQRENGFIQLACDLNIALAAARLGEAQRLILGVVLQQVYGPRKFPAAAIDMPGLAATTGIMPTSLYRALRGLIESRLLVKAKRGRFVFNKDYETWTRDGLPMLTQPMIKFAQAHDGATEKVNNGVHTEAEIDSQKVNNGVHTERTTVFTKVNNGVHSPQEERASRGDLRREREREACAARDIQTQTPDPIPPPHPELAGLTAWLDATHPEAAPIFGPALADLLTLHSAAAIREAVADVQRRKRVVDKLAYARRILATPPPEVDPSAGPGKPITPRKPEPDRYTQPPQAQRIQAALLAKSIAETVAKMTPEDRKKLEENPDAPYVPGSIDKPWERHTSKPPKPAAKPPADPPKPTPKP